MMRIRVARHGDDTTTGGCVFAYQAESYDNGVKLALNGERATCGNCEGQWPISGTGDEMCDNGTPVVLHWDRIECPCGKNRMITREDGNVFIHKTRDALAACVGEGSAQGTSTLFEDYDEQFILCDSNGQPLADCYYTVRTSSGEVHHGITDSTGRTSRYETYGAGRMTIYIGHRSM